jgi:hypothetical protein
MGGIVGGAIVGIVLMFVVDSSLERIAKRLLRIAKALEKLAGITSPPDYE